MTTGGAVVDASTKARARLPPPPGSRFSLLHLDEGEDYVVDFAGSLKAPPGVLPAASDPMATPSRQNGKLRGRIRLLTRSLAFEPDDPAVAVLKFPLKHVVRLDPVGSLGFDVHSHRVLHIRPMGEDVPYHIDDDRSHPPWRFDLIHDDVAKVLEPAAALLRVSRAPHAKAEETLAAMRRRREERRAFDRSRLRRPDETILFDAPAAQITPLVREPGRLVVTDARAYFQPTWDLACVGVRCLAASDVVAVARRRHTLRPLAVEVFFDQADGEERARGFTGTSALFALRTEEARESCVRALTGANAGERRLSEAEATPKPESSPGPSSPPSPTSGVDAKSLSRIARGSALLEGRGAWLSSATSAWRDGRLSNFEYLLYLNLAAGRGCNDLAQWPVMPWVLRDYDAPFLDLDDPKAYRDLARPVGALNPERLAVLRERAKQMRETGMEPYLYGTHYSAPGYVLYWLLRAAPAHHLRLQNGKYDAPDRLFHSVAESWESALTSSADVKELIPEFFTLPGDFLRNARGLPLGARQKDGVALGDVTLPRWARGSPEAFLRGHRAALESARVSARLHHWIDLVFGHKQSGPSAEAADNTFHPLTYQGALFDLDETEDAAERAAAEAQINEFGQAPRKLFSAPHPPRMPNAHESYVDRDEDWDPASFDSRSSARDGSVPASRGGEIAMSAAVRARNLVARLAETLEPSASDREDASSIPDEDDETKTKTKSKSKSKSKTASRERFANDAIATADDAARATEPDVDSDSIGVDSDTDVACSAETRIDGAGVRRAWFARAHRVETVAAAFASSPSPSDANPSLITVGRDSIVKVFDAREGDLRHASLPGATGKTQLTSLALLRPPLDFRVDPAFSDAVPTVLVGSRDGGVHAYSANRGVVLGRLAAHDPSATSAMCAPYACPDRLFTASSDGVARAWDVSDGRGTLPTGEVTVGGAFASTRGLVPSHAAATIGGVSMAARMAAASGAPPSAARAGPDAHVAESEGVVGVDGDSEIRAAACDARGGVVVVGCDDGQVAAWDPRYKRLAWTAEACPNGRAVTGVAISPSGDRIVAACADGRARSLDPRACGEATHTADLGVGALTCAANNGPKWVLFGGKDGRVAAWDPAGAGGEPFAVRGVVKPKGEAAVSCVAAAREGGAFAVGWSDGSVGVFVER